MLMVTLAVYSIDQFHASQSEAGLASSIFVLGAVLVRPIAGKMIDTGREKKAAAVRFDPISCHDAHCIFQLTAYRFYY